MKGLRKCIGPLCGLATLACMVANVALAQDEVTNPQPRYAVLTPHLRTDIQPPATPLTTWNGTFTYSGKNYSYNMVGTAPSSNSSTTVTAYVIPVKIVISGHNGGTYDPSHVLSNGKSVTNNTTASPIFDKTTTYVQGGVNVGTTQYIDAYQRANFWGTVQTSSNYHLLLGGPTVLAEQTLSPPSRYGKTGTVFGFKAGMVDINWFDSQLPALMSKLGITPNTFPIFLTYDVYLTQNGCCIGGYHSSTGSSSAPQSYAHATYVDVPGVFAQDVSALSHEVGEWADDPLVVNIGGNNTPCGILENGDPLENNANYGAYPYVLNGFTYNLQDLVTLPYFGAPTSTSVNNWLSFQGASLGVCSNGP